MRKVIVLVLITILLFVVGCSKPVQKEVPVNAVPIKEPVKNVSIEPSVPSVPEEVKPVEEVEPPKFVSGMNCSAGLFKFIITNVGDENLSITKVYMHIKAKLFFPTCDVMVLEPGNSVSCAQRYYTNIVGDAPVKIEAKIGKNVQSYIETVTC